MTAAIKTLSILLFLGLISEGYGSGSRFCRNSDVNLNQSQSGAQVKGKPEWVVTITNKCPCVIQQVTLNCTGFQTVEPIDSSTLKVSGDKCLLIDGKPINNDASVTFKYASDKSFPFNAINVAYNNC
ncbi:hypothetical protein TanjilG_07821 [Lupinus angustifolius]|uniref:Expansin-like EG45 domain-containing protein n=1 Tax=Lupinus angustifolius TaxID=3871 RepID=A0A1J7FP28_LUPAN|nr:PREDICTED: protein TAPETUM DETERMINANT 1-like [Lupinus angustifolius]OIV89671.1 hypothetical protein TanjilG_07821 [Lupinus angustifolius]